MARKLKDILESFGGKHNPVKTLHKGSLGNMKERVIGQTRKANQRRTPGTYAEEVADKAMEKVINKKGRTETRKPATPVELEPTNRELTTNH